MGEIRKRDSIVNRAEFGNLKQYLLYGIDTEEGTVPEERKRAEESYERFYGQLEQLCPGVRREDDDLFHAIDAFAAFHDELFFESGMKAGYRLARALEQDHEGGKRTESEGYRAAEKWPEDEGHRGMEKRQESEGHRETERPGMEKEDGQECATPGELTQEQTERLISEAFAGQERAYASYSRYAVGAALLCGDHSVVRGCNIENASYGASVCAERTALFTAVVAGHREFAALAIVAGNQEKKGESGGAQTYPSPCGICRQVLREFCDPQTFPVIMARSVSDYRVMTLAQLLPESFGPEFLQQE
ncbi:MAG: cytidine deaminase [Eubacteriales bacterium]|nr:cytidine deaminase [Eubacteriales bacterium]